MLNQNHRGIRTEKSLVKTIAGTILVLAALGGAVDQSNATIVRVMDYSYFTQGASNAKNLDNYNDFTVNGEVPIDRNHHFGFSLNESGTERLCGNASNNNPFNIQNVAGAYVDMLLGQKPTGMIDSWDLTGDGIGDHDTVSGMFYIDINDKHYIAGDFFGIKAGDAYGVDNLFGKIELNGSEDINQLPAWPGFGVPGAYLPTINLVPEPLTLSFLSLGAIALLRSPSRRKRI